jgi:superfamily I DNA/RNA helicase
MPTIIFTKTASTIDASVKKKAYTFLEKLTTNDTTVGLHIEPIGNSADPKVRTGRVDDYYRAVLFRIPSEGDTLYVFHGIWPHDEAIAVARKTVLSVNPVNGVTEIRVIETPAATTSAPDAPGGPTPAAFGAPVPAAPGAPAPATLAPGVPAEPRAVPVLERHGVTTNVLVHRIGIEPGIAERAMAATDDDQLLAVAGEAVEWQGLALLDLGAGHDVADVLEKYELTTPTPAPGTGTATSADEQLVQGLNRPAAQLSFAPIAGNDELRRVIESGDFGAWRVFLHPVQRRYAERSFNGPFRLCGGAGTGKTVVILHRARMLSRRTPGARILVTTFTTNLADAVRRDLHRLDPALPIATGPGEPGIYVAGIDAVANTVLRAGRADLDQDVRAVLGDGGAVSTRMAPNPWKAALEVAGGNLPDVLRSETFLTAEYGSVVLPHRITTREQYLRVRRPGRGVALDRARRAAVWDVVAACRSQARVNGTLEFAEACAIAAEHLTRRAEVDGHLFDHVVVDEGQDLAPTHWQLLRALVGEHADDLFIAEDSHQRIYGRRVVLGQYGIRIVGRSQRLTLNYRITAQTLRWALGVLGGAGYLDLEEEPERAGGYRSARTGVDPQRLSCGSLSEELDRAAEVVRGWVRDCAARETIAVLVRDRWQRDRVAAGFAERGVTIRAVDREEIKPGQPVVMTMHRAKGTEFSKVLLFALAEGNIPASLRDHRYSDEARQDAELRERSLLYVAATRARDEVAFTFHGAPSPLLPRPTTHTTT